MKLKRLSFINHRTGWNVKDVDFDDLTLFVGASGVGKTQILHSILLLSQVARGRSLNGVEWVVYFTNCNKDYVWSGSFETSKEINPDIVKLNEAGYNIVKETLTEGENLIIDRDKERLIYNGVQTVKLDTNRSAISLLKEEALIEPVYQAFRKIYKLDTENRGIRITPAIINGKEEAMDLAEIKRFKSLSPIEKLFLLKKNDLNEFDIIKDNFTEIFPLVEDIDFDLNIMFNKRNIPILKIKEKYVDEWISQNNISSGMYRALSQIVTLTLADDGDIILIDEFENGLGVNCINQLADIILYPETDIQVIITSHHPYIINTIPYSRWKVVTRRGSDVNVHTTKELNIGEHSKHDAFMQLVQSQAYQTGQI